MDKKFQKNETPKHHAASNCSASCNKCNGQCSLDNQHNGQHRCRDGHNWA